MSLAEFNERQAEMNQEIAGAGDNAAAAQRDQVSKVGSSVSKPVMQSNME